MLKGKQSKLVYYFLARSLRLLKCKKPRFNTELSLSSGGALKPFLEFIQILKGFRSYSRTLRRFLIKPIVLDFSFPIC